MSQQKLTVGLDLGDRNSWYCVLDESGQIQLERRVRTNAKALREVFGEMPHQRIALEIGTHSPWISRLLSELGHEVIVANARKVRLIGESRKKDDRLEPLLACIESVSEQIREYNQRIEKLAQDSYPQVGLLKQIKGVGTLIGLTFLLTLEDPHRFRKSRDVGCYLGLQPGRRNSGRSEPQMHISKEGDPYLRTLLVQGAQHILGPFGVDCDLRRWGLKLAERGGKSGKKRAIIATARKLAVLLHHLWVSREVYEPLHNNNHSTMPAAA
jgi:transposase